MGAMKTPEVYIVEENALSDSVVEVATAVPAFIGYTENAADGSKSLLYKPWRVTSITEFRSYFGDAPTPYFAIREDAASPSGISLNKKNYVVSRNDRYIFYYNMLLFFANGGGPCYIVSVGDYGSGIEKEKLEAGIAPLLKEQEPTLVVIPEAVCLTKAEDCYALQQAVLKHCGCVMKNRFAILDIYNGYRDRKDPGGDPVNVFREAIGSDCLDYGAAYYPWLNTSIVQESELGFANLNIDELRPILLEEAELGNLPEENKTQAKEYIGKLGTELPEADAATLHKVLLQLSPLYRELMKEMRISLNLLPVSAAMAGVYTMTDNTRGVWKAPANTSIATVVSPAVIIAQEEQEDLNVNLSGKAVNAVRTIAGKGIQVWGARTLDGNSLDWRYINVRRTMIMLEESIRNAVRACVFDPNVSDAQASVKGMIDNFLNGIWKRGGLAGAIPGDAYSVHIDMGETMTPEDILEGVLRVTVLVALARPAEFMGITFQQPIQKS